MEVTGDEIAEAVQRQFDRLPQKRKPQARGDGVQEWVPLSGIVAKGRDNLECIALGTGMKCLPQNKISQARGVVLHDWHAEVIAMRSFNYFLLKECQGLAQSREQRSKYVRRRTQSEMTDSHFQPFILNEDISLHMYCSESPCGDASMELTIAAQEDPTPWTLPPTPAFPHPSPSFSSSPHLTPSLVPPLLPLPGRSYFSHLGLVRHKPSRADAPPTFSKSCSDKLSLKEATSLLSGVVSLLVSPANAYLATLTLPAGHFSKGGCGRAFGCEGEREEEKEKKEREGEEKEGGGEEKEKEKGDEREKEGRGRMRSLKSRSWGDSGYRFVRFEVLVCGERREFVFSRRRGGLGLGVGVEEGEGEGEGERRGEGAEKETEEEKEKKKEKKKENINEEKLVPSNLATTWTPHSEETLVGGVLQGRKQSDMRGASVLCRKRMWALVAEVAGALTVRDEVPVPTPVPTPVPAAAAAVRKSLSLLLLDVERETYGMMKGCGLLEVRRRVKADVRGEALRGWVANEGDEGWGVGRDGKGERGRERSGELGNK